MQLTAENVSKIFMDCLFTDGEDTKGAIIGHGIRSDFGFEPTRLFNNTEGITDMVNQLPAAFKDNIGGGASFLNMALNKEGEQWANLDITMEQLLALGTAIGKMGFKISREFWQSFRGGMPYVYVKN